MEFRSERSSHSHGHGSDDDAIIIKDEKRSDESSVGGGDDDDDEDDRPKQETSIEEPPPPMTKTEKSVLEAVPITASSTKKEEVDELENAKAEMGEVIEENQRLKMCLNRILNDYKTLQVQFHNIVQQDQTKNPPNNNKAHEDIHNNSHQEMLLEESELVSLSLGRLPNNPRTSIEKVKVSKPLKLEDECKEEEEGLELGLECKFETSKSESTTEHLPNNNNYNNNPISPRNSSEAPKEEEAGETWPPRKVLKSTTTRDGGGEDEVSQQSPAKKARVCVRARCDTPTMNDGCQWRKYGQKISKGNPCPRAYYRCTVAPSCPVRKQVQRCAQDMSILITTYEGTHNHPLPLSATAMASTTSAAASMLLSGSSSSTSHHSSSIPSSISTTHSSLNTNLLPHHHGMNLFLSDGSKSRQFYLSHPSSLSSSTSHPTITLDLTTTSSNPSSSSSSASFSRLNTNFNNKYPSSTSLNFSSNNPSESNAISWTNNSGFLTYSNNNNRNNILSTINLGRSQPVENFYHSFMPRNNNNVPISSHQNSLPDTIAAATKVITADPNFQSALAAALTSIISTQGNNQGGVGENLGQKMKWGEIFQAANNNNNSSTLPSTSKANTIGCASSFLNKAAPANNNNTQTTGNNNLVFQPSPSLPYPGTKSASGSPGDNRDNTN